MNELGCRFRTADSLQSSVKVMCRSPRSFRYRLDLPIPARGATSSTEKLASRSAARIRFATKRVPSSISMLCMLARQCSPCGSDLAGATQTNGVEDMPGVLDIPCSAGTARSLRAMENAPDDHQALDVPALAQ